MKIRGEALELALRVVLSCPCPVTPEQERRVFDIVRALEPPEEADYRTVLAIFTSTDTPFHRLAEFVQWMTPVGEEPLIERHHVLRANASTAHWRHAAATLPGAVGRVACLSSWLTAHLVLPVRLTMGDDGLPEALYEYPAGGVTLRHVFLPPEYAPERQDGVAFGDNGVPAGHGGVAAGHGWWAIHFAAVLGPVSDEERQLLVELTEANPELAVHRSRLETIDYRDFELQGDNAAFCRRRHAAYWGDMS